VYWIVISRDFKRLFNNEKVWWYSIKTFIKYKKILWYSIKTIRSFFSGQPILLVFNWDFSWLVSCLLEFKSLSILMDSWMEWILWDFLVKSINTTSIQQSHTNSRDFAILFQTFIYRHLFHSRFLLFLC